MACAMCNARGKTWQGSDPKCAFEGATFSGENWNCATAGEIRGFIDETSGRVQYMFCDDQKYATIAVHDLRLPSGSADALWVYWYKNRGRTDAMWLLGSGPPRPPTEADCLVVAEALLKEEV